MAQIQEALNRSAFRGKDLPFVNPFRGQNHPKNRKKLIRLEQWIEVRIHPSTRAVTTKLYPSNRALIEEGKAMWPPPQAVYRRINFPDGIPEEYNWAMGPEHQALRTYGGCGIQRMTVETWFKVIEKEARRTDGHVGPTGVPALPRPDGTCHCRACTAGALSLLNP